VDQTEADVVLVGGHDIEIAAVDLLLLGVGSSGEQVGAKLVEGEMPYGVCLESGGVIWVVVVDEVVISNQVLALSTGF
jgi:hypothetical protein